MWLLGEQAQGGAFYLEGVASLSSDGLGYGGSLLGSGRSSLGVVQALT